MAKLLIDECLHASLLELAHAAGHAADHVNYLGLGSSKDRELMALILEQDYTFVTNNRSDFLTLYRGAPLHTGLLVIVPSVRVGPGFDATYVRRDVACPRTIQAVHKRH